MSEELKPKADDAEVMRIWRECGLPEYFLGNGGTNHKLVAFAKACASPTPPTTEGRGTIPFDKTDLAQLQQVREELRNRWRASAWQLLCRTIDDLESRALLSSPRVEEVRRMREALEEWFRWDLVIESAVRNDAPSDHAAIVRVIKKGRAALSLPDGEGDKQATRAEDGPTAPTDRL